MLELDLAVEQVAGVRQVDRGLPRAELVHPGKADERREQHIRVLHREPLHLGRGESNRGVLARAARRPRTRVGVAGNRALVQQVGPACDEPGDHAASLGILGGPLREHAVLHRLHGRDGGRLGVEVPEQPRGPLLCIHALVVEVAETVAQCGREIPATGGVTHLVGCREYTHGAREAVLAEHAQLDEPEHGGLEGGWREVDLVEEDQPTMCKVARPLWRGVV